MGLNACAANGVAVLITVCNSVGPEGVRVLARENRFMNPNTLSRTQINTKAKELGDRKPGFVNANTVASSTVCGHKK